MVIIDLITHDIPEKRYILGKKAKEGILILSGLNPKADHLVYWAGPYEPYSLPQLALKASLERPIQPKENKVCRNSW